MRDFEVNGFLFSLPIWTVFRGLEQYADGTVRFAGYATCNVGAHRSLCLFTDTDLAHSHREAMIEMLSTTDLCVGRFSEVPHLVRFLNKVQTWGVGHVVFDIASATGRIAQFVAIEDLVGVLSDGL